MNSMTVLTTKTIFVDTDPISACVLRERIEKAGKDEDFDSFEYSYEYDKDIQQASYVLTGDDALIEQILALLAEPVTQEERKASVRAERIRSGFYRRTALLAASAASMALSLLLLHESK
ncbi:MAG: hypothetical protein E7464_01665 [Ruminococcaceae bacterium]|nr:hypothetical protein [Oscillospiraceae bacterium]